MIKVFQVIECGGPGGAGEQVAAICNGLDPARFEVALAYAVRGGTPEEYRAQCRGAKHAHYIPELTREISPALDARAFAKLRRLFLEYRPDVVHTHSSKAGALARPAAKIAGVDGIFYSPHGYNFLMQDRSVLQRAFYRSFERLAGRIGRTIAVGPSEAALARQLVDEERALAVYNAYLGDFPEPLPHEGVVVGACGRMTYARNPDAWALLAQRLTDSRNGLTCVWIGGGEDEARIRTYLTNMNLLDKVQVTGWLAADAARERLRALDIFMHYSRWDVLTSAVVQAMACGLPVVASDIPGNRDAVVDGVTGFLVRSEVELLERCQQLNDDEPLRRRLGAAGRERVRREFSRGRMIDELSRLYTDALK